jgi:lipoprotein-releasing system permease protein
MWAWLPTDLRLAWRFLIDGKAQTILTTVGASIGVAVVLFMIGLLAAVEDNIFGRVLSMRAHVTVLPERVVPEPPPGTDGARHLAVVVPSSARRLSIDQWQVRLADLQAEGGVRVAAPVLSGNALAVSGSASKSVTLMGIEPESYFRIVDVPGHVTSGGAELTGSSVLIGSGIAQELGLEPGGKLRLRTPDGATTVHTVAGVFSFGAAESDDRTILATLREAQSALGLVGAVNGIDVTLDDPFAAKTFAAAATAGTALDSENWIDQMADMFTALNTQEIANLAVQLLVALSVALGIASVLVVSVIQRVPEIGILRAMGASRALVLRVFLIQGAVLGLAGAAVGTALAFGFLAAWRGLVRHPDGTPPLEITLAPSTLVGIALASVLIGLVAAIVPAVRAARLRPAEAIRA